MATVSGAAYSDSQGATEVLFNVQFSEDSLSHTGLQNKIDIQVALDNLVSEGQLQSSPGPQVGYTEYTNLATGQKFFFIGPEASGKAIHFGKDGDGIVDTFKNNQVEAGAGANTLQIMDNAQHTVHTHGGDDVVAITGTGRVNLYTGTGNDKVTVVGDNNNQIKTKAGDDILIVDHGSGKNTLAGGDGADYFVIGGAKTGKDTITDFGKKDVLQIMDRNGDGKVDSADVLSIEQHGKDTIITLLDGEKVVLKNVDHKHLHDDDGDGTFTLS
jgi:hypothetical protein